MAELALFWVRIIAVSVYSLAVITAYSVGREKNNARSVVVILQETQNSDEETPNFSHFVNSSDERSELCNAIP